MSLYGISPMDGDKNSGRSLTDTMDIYGHLLPSIQAAATELIDGLVSRIEVKLDDLIIII